jgi:putative oxidoreductase
MPFINPRAAPAEQAFVQQLMFFKNLAVVGGLLVLASAGAGQWSIDGKAARAVS